MPARILVGDDHEEMRSLIVTLLEAEGYEVREATDTQGVLDEIARAKPDLLILDVHMPGGGGIQALRTIRSDPDLEALRVLLLSGTVDMVSDWPTDIGADARLPKPFPVDDLRQTVSSLLAG